MNWHSPFYICKDFRHVKILLQKFQTKSHLHVQIWKELRPLWPHVTISVAIIERSSWSLRDTQQTFRLFCFLNSSGACSESFSNDFWKSLEHVYVICFENPLVLFLVLHLCDFLIAHVLPLGFQKHSGSIPEAAPEARPASQLAESTTFHKKVKNSIQ